MPGVIKPLKQEPGPAYRDRIPNWTDVGFKLLLWFLGLSVIGVLIWRVGWDQIGPVLGQADPRLLLLLCLLQAVTLLLCAGQLWSVLRCAEVHLPFLRVFTIYMAGGFVESVTPALKFGGEGVKIYLLKQQAAVDYQQLVGGFLTYKLLSIVPFSLLLASASLFHVRMATRVPPVVPLGLLLLVGGLACWILVRPRSASMDSPKPAKGAGKVRRFVVESLIHAQDTANGPRLAAMLLVWAGIWLLYPVKLALVGVALGVRLPLIPLAAVLYSSYLISMLPLAPGGLGSFEGSLVLFLGGLGVGPQTALALALMLRSVTYWFPLLPMGYCALRVLLKRSASESESPRRKPEQKREAARPRAMAP